MKKACKKILAVVMAVAMVLAVVPIMASAKTKYPKIDGIEVRGKYVVEVDESIKINKSKDADTVSVCWYGSNSYSVDYENEDEQTSVELWGECEGVELLLVEEWTLDRRGDYDEYVDGYFIIVVVESEDYTVSDMGYVEEIYDVYDWFNYKDSNNYATYLYASIDADSDSEYLEITEYWVPDYETSEVYVDEEGYVDTYSVGSASGTYYVIDAQGNIFSASYSVDVSYSFFQMLIRIFLFGWLWY